MHHFCKEGNATYINSEIFLAHRVKRDLLNTSTFPPHVTPPSHPLPRPYVVPHYKNPVDDTRLGDYSSMAVENETDEGQEKRNSCEGCVKMKEKELKRQGVVKNDGLWNRLSDSLQCKLLYFFSSSRFCRFSRFYSSISQGA